MASLEIGKVCVVGLGLQGLDLVDRLVQSPHRWQIVAVADLSTAAYARFQSKYHTYRIPYFRTVDEALTARSVDAIVVATTAPAHVIVAKAAIQAGHNSVILVEKPIATSLGEARSLETMIAERQWPGSLAVGHYRRCSEIYAQVWQVINEGSLGNLQRIEFARGGKLSMRGSHYIDLANWFFGAKAVEISCKLEAKSKTDHRGAFYYDPAADVQITYANGGVFLMDTVAGSKRYRPGTTLLFERGEVTVDEPEYAVSIRGTDVPERTYQSPDLDWHVRHLAWFENTLAALHFGNSYRPCSLTAAIATLELIVAAHHSNQKNGAPVALPLPPSADADVLRIA